MFWIHLPVERSFRGLWRFVSWYFSRLRKTWWSYDVRSIFMLRHHFLHFFHKDVIRSEIKVLRYSLYTLIYDPHSGSNNKWTKTNFKKTKFTSMNFMFWPTDKWRNYFNRYIYVSFLFMTSTSAMWNYHCGLIKLYCRPLR